MWGRFHRILNWILSKWTLLIRLHLVPVIWLLEVKIEVQAILRKCIHIKSKVLLQPFSKFFCDLSYIFDEMLPIHGKQRGNVLIMQIRMNWPQSFLLNVNLVLFLNLSFVYKIEIVLHFMFDSYSLFWGNPPNHFLLDDLYNTGIAIAIWKKRITKIEFSYSISNKSEILSQIWLCQEFH